MMNNLKRSTFKGNFIMSLNEMLGFNQNNIYNYTFKACREVFVTVSVVIYFRKHFFLIDAINDVIGKLESGGLIEQWHSNFLDERLLNADTSHRGPKKLTVNQLLGCLELYCGGCLLATVCFAAELIFCRLCGKTAKRK